MNRTAGVLLAMLLLSGSASAGHLKTLRVCGDPDNLPFSNDRQEGFENKIAEVIARDLGLALSYYWWPHQRGLVRNTLRAEKCDVLIGIPKGYDLVLWTKPYYRSTYALVYASGSGLAIRSLDDPALRRLRVGVHSGTPPQELLAERGILDNVVPYLLLHQPHDPNPDLRPAKLVEDVIAGRLDVAIVWGPWAGYYVKKQNVTTLAVVPLADDGGPVPLSFDISMGVAKGERELKGELEASLARRAVEIAKILDDYGVPRLPPRSGGPRPGAAGQGAGDAPASHKHEP